MSLAVFGLFTIFLYLMMQAIADFFALFPQTPHQTAARNSVRTMRKLNRNYINFNKFIMCAAYKLTLASFDLYVIISVFRFQYMWLSCFVAHFYLTFQHCRLKCRRRQSQFPNCMCVRVCFSFQKRVCVCVYAALCRSNFSLLYEAR